MYSFRSDFCWAENLKENKVSTRRIWHEPDISILDSLKVKVLIMRRQHTLKKFGRNPKSDRD